jgi:hypothetical protein
LLLRGGEGDFAPTLAERLTSGAFADKKALPGIIDQARKNRQIFSFKINAL